MIHREKDQQIELRVRVSDGSFDTSVELPINACPEARDAVVRAWLDLIQAALRVTEKDTPGEPS